MQLDVFLSCTQHRRCRGKFAAPGKFFPPPYCYNWTNAIPNPNLNPSPKPNPNLNPTPNPNPTLSLILTLTRTAAFGNNFPVRQIFHYTGTSTLYSHLSGVFMWLEFDYTSKKEWKRQRPMCTVTEWVSE